MLNYCNSLIRKGIGILNYVYSPIFLSQHIKIYPYIPHKDIFICPSHKLMNITYHTQIPSYEAAAVQVSINQSLHVHINS